MDDPAEALRALYMFSRNSPIYEMLFARMSSAQAADLNTLTEVVDEFTVVRLEPSDEAPALPTVELFSESVRQVATVVALVMVLRLVFGVDSIKRVGQAALSVTESSSAEDLITTLHTTDT